MITFSSVDFNAWISLYLYPLVRIFALLATAPPFNNAALPRRLRLILGLAIAMAIAPLVPPPAGIAPGSGAGMALLAEQILIGAAMGFVLRLVFATVSMAGDIIGLQMGLGFATFYDPQNTAQTPVVSEFLGLLASLTFLAMNGHLMVIATLAESFQVLPIGGDFPNAATFTNIARMGSIVFATGVLLSLPVLASLMVTNIALGVLTRAAPQLNLFAIGFPLTLSGGFLILILCMNYLSQPLLELFETGLNAMLGIFVFKP